MHVYNTTASPVVIDGEGHTIDGRRWGDADGEFDGTTSAIGAGALLTADEAAAATPETTDVPPTGPDPDSAGDGNPEPDKTTTAAKTTNRRRGAPPKE